MRVYKQKSTQDWKPLPGRVLLGRVEERGTLPVDGKDRPFLTVQAEDGFWRLYESKALEDVWSVANVGDWVEIEFLGKVQLTGGRSFNRFRTAVFTLEAGEQPPFVLSPLKPKPINVQEVSNAEATGGNAAPEAPSKGAPASPAQSSGTRRDR